MNLQTDTYKVRHSWGDPREPEYQNGRLVSTVAYCENGSSIHFKIVASNDKHPSDVKWLIVAPPALRRALGKRWIDRELIFGRIIDHLTRVDKPGNPQNKVSYFSNIEMDLSRVEGWSVSNIKALKTKYPLISVSLPAQEVFMLLAVGFLFYGTNQTFLFFQDNVSAPVFVSIGILSIVLMIKDCKKCYSAIVGFYLMQSLVNKKKDWVVRTANNLLKVYWRRYLVTLMLSIFLIKLGVGNG